MPFANFIGKFFLREISNQSLTTGFALLGIVFFMVLFPSLGFTQEASCNVQGDIPFVATNNTDIRVCVRCDGPWDRVSSIFGEVIKPDGKDCQFYAADQGLFPPFGKWLCVVGTEKQPSLLPCADGSTFASKQLCIKSFEKIGIVIKNDGNGKRVMEVTGGNAFDSFGRCSTKAISVLGDRPQQSKRDKDSFSFEGTEGDEVTITADFFLENGHTGDVVTLILKGNSLNEEVTGSLPQDITSTLPVSGKYTVIVEQPRGAGDERFRGSYSLTPESPNEDLVLEPENDVE